MMLLRRFVILLTSLAFLMTSVGWGMASAFAPLESGKNHHAAVAEAGADEHHDHGQKAVAQASECLEAEGCGADSWQVDLADSCCAMACHVAMKPGLSMVLVMAMFRKKDPILLENGIREASNARLERPPRSAAA